MATLPHEFRSYRIQRHISPPDSGHESHRDCSFKANYWGVYYRQYKSLRRLVFITSKWAVLYRTSARYKGSLCTILQMPNLTFVLNGVQLTKHASLIERSYLLKDRKVSPDFSQLPRRPCHISDCVCSTLWRSVRSKHWQPMKSTVASATEVLPEDVPAHACDKIPWCLFADFEASTMPTH